MSEWKEFTDALNKEMEDNVEPGALIRWVNKITREAYEIGLREEK